MAYKIKVIVLMVLGMAFLILGTYSDQHNDGTVTFFFGLFFGKISSNLYYIINNQQKANKTIRLMNIKNE